VLSSVRERGGLEALRSALRNRTRAEHPTIELEIPVTDGKTLAQAYREAEVLGRTDTDARVRVLVRASRALIGAWEQQPEIRVLHHDPMPQISPDR
jgi:50S ribosomal subunit-associated GTPase HflX